MTPIIDVHTHIFNAIDIPVEGYLRSRRRERRKLLNLEYIAGFVPGPHIFAYLADRMRERCITRKLGVGEKGVIYRFLLWLFGYAMQQRLSDWEESLSKDVQSLAQDMVDTWEDVDLYVPLMVDYEYWFKNTVDTDMGDQIDCVYKDVVLPHKGRIHPFAPFCPARELTFRKQMQNPDGQLETRSSLEMLKDAITNKGFIGVKVYNSLGYKPFKNQDVDDERKRMAIRNGKMRHLFRGEEYDEVLSELYDYCIENEVPITAHCQIGGIEAYPEASFHFGAAAFWREVLDQEEYKHLRVNLAHFGWNQSPGQGYNGNQSWVKEICRMMVEYRSLYADVSHHRVVSARQRRDFKSGYEAMRSDFSESIQEIKKKILYGSDWHVLRRLKNYGRFKQGYTEVLRHDGFFSGADLEGFFSGNALDFLGLRPGGKNRERLSQFYAANGITPPAWFQATSGP